MPYIDVFLVLYTFTFLVAAEDGVGKCKLVNIKVTGQIATIAPKGFSTVTNPCLQH